MTCRCGHTRIVEVTDLLATDPGETMAGLKRRLRCRACQRKGQVDLSIVYVIGSDKPVEDPRGPSRDGAVHETRDPHRTSD